MKTCLLILCFFATILSVSAQNPNLDFKYALKGYNQASYSHGPLYRSVNLSTTQHLSFFKPVIGLQWQNKKQNGFEATFNQLSTNYSESKVIELDSAGQPKVVDGGSSNSFDLSVGFEYLQHLNKNKNTKLVPSLGFGIHQYVNFYNFNSYHQSQHKFNTKTFGTRFFVTPRLMYFFSPKFFLDLNLPVCLFQFENTTFKETSIDGPMGMNGMGIGDGNTLPGLYYFRIGLGYKL